MPDIEAVIAPDRYAEILLDRLEVWLSTLFPLLSSVEMSDLCRLTDEQMLPPRGDDCLRQPQRRWLGAPAAYGPHKHLNRW
jgi:hypothetical protein